MAISQASMREWTAWMVSWLLGCEKEDESVRESGSISAKVHTAGNASAACTRGWLVLAYPWFRSIKETRMRILFGL